MVFKAESHSEQRKMCPKHGIAHGVCVDPIKAEAPPEESLQVGGLGGTSTASCTLCGETGITFPHTCPGSSGGQDHLTPVQPNRFDPYEALDIMEAMLDSSECLPTHTSRGDGYLIVDADFHTAKHQLHALRAYITGMEHGS